LKIKTQEANTIQKQKSIKLEIQWEKHTRSLGRGISVILKMMFMADKH